jgi:hypothetical protein
VLRSSGVVLAVTLAMSLFVSRAVARADSVDPPPPLTHTTPLSPTGDVVPRGHFQRTQSVTAFVHHMALGLGGGAEVSLTSPFLPIPIAGGDVELRISLLPPDSHAALVLGAAVTLEWINGFDAWTGATATFAWRAPRWSAHATLRAANHAASPERFGLATAGVTHAVGRTGLAYVELADLGWLHPSDPCAVGGTFRSLTPPSCMERDAVQLLWIGAWWKARSMRGGISAAILRASPSLVVPVLPMLSFAWDKDL